jgi:hypothetical protein
LIDIYSNINTLSIVVVKFIYHQLYSRLPFADWNIAR